LKKMLGFKNIHILTKRKFSEKFYKVTFSGIDKFHTGEKLKLVLQQLTELLSLYYQILQVRVDSMKMC
jgi:hypothetical protein